MILQSITKHKYNIKIYNSFDRSNIIIFPSSNQIYDILAAFAAFQLTQIQNRKSHVFLNKIVVFTFKDFLFIAVYV